jgi:hypothetical protein
MHGPASVVGLQILPQNTTLFLKVIFHHIAEPAPGQIDGLNLLRLVEIAKTARRGLLGVVCGATFVCGVASAPIRVAILIPPFRAEPSTINPLPATRCTVIEWHRPFKIGRSGQLFRVLPLVRCKRYCLRLKLGSLVRNRRRCFLDKVID